MNIPAITALTEAFAGGLNAANAERLTAILAPVRDAGSAFEAQIAAANAAEALETWATGNTTPYRRRLVDAALALRAAAAGDDEDDEDE